MIAYVTPPKGMCIFISSFKIHMQHPPFTLLFLLSRAPRVDESQVGFSEYSPCLWVGLGGSEPAQRWCWWGLPLPFGGPGERLPYSWAGRPQPGSPHIPWGAEVLMVAASWAPALRKPSFCLATGPTDPACGTAQPPIEPLQVFHPSAMGQNIEIAFLRTLRVIKGATRRNNHVQRRKESTFKKCYLLLLIFPL